MHVLLTVSSLSRLSGGPSVVVQCLSEQLVASGHAVTLLTNSIHTGESELLPRDARVNIIHASSGGRGGFRDCLTQLLESKTIDLVHDFGLWLPNNHAVASECHNANTPFVSSPSGMLAGWALRHKKWKKMLAWWLYQKRDLTRASLLAATAAQEVVDIRKRLPGKPVALIPNGVEIPVIKNFSRATSAERARTVVFLGRIHPVKGLKNLVEAWSMIKPMNWRCILAGPDEAGHQGELQTLIEAKGLTREFEFLGLADGDRKWNVLAMADVFVLPSYTENFGISAAEALACAVPVITTKGTPWKDLVEYRCGWWVDIGAAPLASALKGAISLSDEQRHDMGLRGRKLMEEKFSWNIVGREMISAYKWILGQQAKPECVDSR